ncbi:MAG TPA: hypothetical protein ENJ08_02845 [Gammaproteobacteria bacterium]|nr:hypothetical protein [Gammaproteobacteria bacterium]
MRFTNQQITEMSRGEFFGKGNAQLPDALMLMIDEIESISAEGGNYNKGQLAASLRIHPDHWFFECHFKPGKIS